MAQYDSSFTGQHNDEYDSRIAALESWQSDINTWKNNLLNTIYPIGSVYNSTTSTLPANTFGGTWTLLNSHKDIICVGSQVIYDNLSGSGNVSKTPFLGAYVYDLIDKVFTNTTCPSGYHPELRMTCQFTTSGDTALQLFLNNISTNSAVTWSGTTYRHMLSTRFFRTSEITQTTTYGYNSNGTNLYYQVTGAGGPWQFWNVTIHGYFVSDSIIYKYKRTA